jgi:hypothetical protein
MDPRVTGSRWRPSKWGSNPLVRIRKDLKSEDFKRSRYRVIRPVAPVRAEATTRVTAPRAPKAVDISGVFVHLGGRMPDVARPDLARPDSPRLE